VLASLKIKILKHRHYRNCNYLKQNWDYFHFIFPSKPPAVFLSTANSSPAPSADCLMHGHEMLSFINFLKFSTSFLLLIREAFHQFIKVSRLNASLELIGKLCSTLHLRVSLIYREAKSYVSHHSTSKHQCTRLGSVPNLNSQASSPF